MKSVFIAKFLITLLAYNGKLGSGICASKMDFWNQIDATKKNMSTFSFQCQAQMVKVESKIYLLDRLRSSLKSGYIEKLFTSDDFKQNIGVVLEIPLKNSEVFPDIVDLIHGKELTDILNKDNYFPLLKAMDHLQMEIDLQTVSSFMDENLKSYSLQDAKTCELYKFIRENSTFEYLFESVFKHFANNLVTLQNHTIFPSIPLDHLIQIINKVEHPNHKKRYEIIQICTQWLCHDMENRLFHMANLVVNIESAFHSLAEKNTGFLKCFPKCNVDKKTKRKIISRCLFALLANKNLDPKRLELIQSNNLKSFSSLDMQILKFYNSVKNNSKPDYLFESVFKYFADNLTVVRNHEIFPSLPPDHLIRIIKSVQDPNDEKRYEIIQMCTEWLSYDMENRLPYLVDLVISAKFLFHSSIEMNTDISKCLPKCHVDEKVKREIISKCLFALLGNGENLNPKILSDDESNYHSDDGYYSEERNTNPYSKEVCVRFVNFNDKYAKLKKFLNNSEFYDITVRAGEKTYKLHRIFLESKSDYFRGIFEAEYAEAKAYSNGAPSCPSKDKEYVLNDDIDPVGFDEVLDNIYFDKNETKISSDNATISIFKAAVILGIEKLGTNCKNILLKKYRKDVSSRNIVQILKFTYGKSEHENLYLPYLYKHIITKWPEIYNVSHFCSISCTMLQTMLDSPHLYLYDLNPDKILDMFSIWIHHDANNRYQYLPRIAQMVNPHCGANHSEYISNSPTELNDFSQSFIRDQLYKILSSPVYMVRSEKLAQKLEEIPVFIASNREYEKNKIILNSNLDVIASYNYSESNPTTSRLRTEHSWSATLINDNLFIFSNYDYPPTFHVYNLLLQKYYSLQTNFLSWHGHYTLLSCNNEIYICSQSGQLIKYSMQFNQWKRLKSNIGSAAYYLHTGDGETLYRMYRVSTGFFSYSNYVLEAYDFGTSLWSPVSTSSSIESHSIFEKLKHFTVVDNRALAVIISNDIFISDRDPKSEEFHWREYRIPDQLNTYQSVFVHCDDRMLVVIDDLLYHYTPANESWTLKKQLPSKETEYYERSPYIDVAGIHRS